MDQHPGFDELVLAELLERAFQCGATVGREAEAEAGDDVLIDAAALEIVAGVGPGEALELLGIPFGDRAHDFRQR